MSSSISSLMRTFSISNRVIKSKPFVQLYLQQYKRVSSVKDEVKPADDGSQEEPSRSGAEYEQLLADKEVLVENTKKEAADLKDKYMRSLAENENVRRQSKKLLSDSKLYAVQRFAKDLLEVADILEKATLAVPEEELPRNNHLKALFEGLQMTDTQLQKVFTEHGIEKINPVDAKFDPNFHEALFQQEFPNKESGTVALVQKVGYRLHGRPLRAALVSVVK